MYMLVVKETVGTGSVKYFGRSPCQDLWQSWNQKTLSPERFRDRCFDFMIVIHPDMGTFQSISHACSANIKCHRPFSAVFQFLVVPKVCLICGYIIASNKRWVKNFVIYRPISSLPTHPFVSNGYVGGPGLQIKFSSQVRYIYSCCCI